MKPTMPENPEYAEEERKKNLEITRSLRIFLERILRSEQDAGLLPPAPKVPSVQKTAEASEWNKDSTSRSSSISSQS
jgi:hypothetical protein